MFTATSPIFFMEIKKIAFGDRLDGAITPLLARMAGFRERALALSPALAGPMTDIRRGLETLETVDRHAQSAGRLDLEGAEALAGALLAELAQVEAQARQAADATLCAEAADFLIGVALWAVRQRVAIEPLEPVVNALAHRANGARSRPELAAVFGLTQGVLEHEAPRLRADLERSNPQRPWRILHANLAITAIRTEDEAMMKHAFDALEAALPDEAAGFYAEALARALSPGVAPEVRERIAARHLKWTAAH